MTTGAGIGRFARKRAPKETVDDDDSKIKSSSTFSPASNSLTNNHQDPSTTGSMFDETGFDSVRPPSSGFSRPASAGFSSLSSMDFGGAFATEFGAGDDDAAFTFGSDSNVDKMENVQDISTSNTNMFNGGSPKGDDHLQTGIDSEKAPGTSSGLSKFSCRSSAMKPSMPTTGEVGDVDDSKPIVPESTNNNEMTSDGLDDGVSAGINASTSNALVEVNSCGVDNKGGRASSSRSIEKNQVTASFSDGNLDKTGTNMHVANTSALSVFPDTTSVVGQEMKTNHQTNNFASLDSSTNADARRHTMFEPKSKSLAMSISNASYDDSSCANTATSTFPFGEEGIKESAIDDGSQHIRVSIDPSTDRNCDSTAKVKVSGGRIAVSSPTLKGINEVPSQSMLSYSPSTPAPTTKLPVEAKIVNSPQSKDNTIFPRAPTNTGIAASSTMVSSTATRNKSVSTTKVPSFENVPDKNAFKEKEVVGELAPTDGVKTVGESEANKKGITTTYLKSNYVPEALPGLTNHYNPVTPATGKVCGRQNGIETASATDKGVPLSGNAGIAITPDPRTPMAAGPSRQNGEQYFVQGSKMQDDHLSSNIRGSISQENIARQSTETLTNATFDELYSLFLNDLRDTTDLREHGDRNLLELEVELANVYSMALRFRGEMMDLSEEVEWTESMADRAIKELSGY